MARRLMTGVDANNQRVSNMGDGSSPTDAVTLQQLQAYVRGLSWKQEVRVAATANVTLTAPGATIDGVTMAVNDRVLLKAQTTASQNGIYVYNGSATAMTRATDANTGPNLINATVFVSEGTTFADTAWVMTTNAPVTVDTTSLTWAQFGGGSAAYLAGNGLSLSGQTFAVVPGSGIVADGTSTRLDTAVAVRKYAANFGDGATTAYAITHNLGTLDVTVQVFDNSTGAQEEYDIVHTSVNVVTITAAVAPATNAKRVVIHG